MEETVSRLEGAYALIFKSRRFPGEAVATRRGSPLLIGVRTESAAQHRPSIPILVDTPPTSPPAGRKGTHAEQALASVGKERKGSWETLLDIGEATEFFLASDASAVVEHTRRVVFLEDDDVAVMKVRASSLR